MKDFKIKMSDAAAEAVINGSELRAINIGVYNRLQDLEHARFGVALLGSCYGPYLTPMSLTEVIDYLTWIKPERYKDCKVAVLFPDCDKEQYDVTYIEERELFIIEPDGDLQPLLVTSSRLIVRKHDVLITQGEVKAFISKLEALLDKARKEVQG